MKIIEQLSDFQVIRLGFEFYSKSLDNLHVICETIISPPISPCDYYLIMLGLADPITYYNTNIRNNLEIWKIYIL